LPIQNPQLELGLPADSRTPQGRLASITDA
jgi:hypothetical protein